MYNKINNFIREKSNIIFKQKGWRNGLMSKMFVVYIGGFEFRILEFLK